MVKSTQKANPEFRLEVSRAAVQQGNTIAKVIPMTKQWNWPCAELFEAYRGGLGIRFQGGAVDQNDAKETLATWQRLVNDVYGDHNVQYGGMPEPGTLKEFWTHRRSA